MPDGMLTVKVDVPPRIREMAARRAIEADEPNHYEAYILDYIEIELNLTAPPIDE